MAEVNRTVVVGRGVSLDAVAADADVGGKWTHGFILTGLTAAVAVSGLMTILRAESLVVN